MNKITSFMREGFIQVLDLNINLLVADAKNLIVSVIFAYRCSSMNSHRGKRGASMAEISPSSSVSQPNGQTAKWDVI